MTLHLDDITLTYPDGDQRLTALDHVSLTAEPGTLTAIVGPSGSGKSSLLAVAATLITPDSGRVVLDGRDLAELNRADTAAVRREQIGIIFQSSNLLASLTATDQLLVVAHMAGHDMTAASERATELLDAVGSPAKPTSAPTSSREDNDSGSPSTPTAAKRSSTCYDSSPPTEASPPSWSPTTSSTSAPPTGSPRSSTARPASSPTGDDQC